MSKLLVGTEERLRRLGKTYSGPPQNTALLLQGYREGVNAAIAAMTEVDLEDEKGSVLKPVCASFSEWSWNDGWTACEQSILARIKEAQ